MQVEARLHPPDRDKNWSLHFTGLSLKPRSEDPFKADVWYWSQHFGGHYGSHPFLQGDAEDWMMVEFWSDSQSCILNTCMAVCDQLCIELQL
jgi:hypothetical protein